MAPATGELRLVSGSDDKTVRVFDPVAGGEALLVINVGSIVLVLAVFADPATGELRDASRTQDERASDFSPTFPSPVASMALMLAIRLARFSVRGGFVSLFVVVSHQRFVTHTENDTRPLLTRRPP